jgi:hypothetical protein
MSTPPEARTEYSRATAVFPAPGGRLQGRLPRLSALLAGTALAGALALCAAEFTALYSIHLVSSGRSAGTVSTGSHNSYALLPLALLAGLLAVGAWRRPGRALHAALAGLGVVTLGIALVGDLPDASSHGLTSHFVLAATTPGTGLYLETLGAVLLIATGVAGLLLTRPERSAV